MDVRMHVCRLGSGSRVAWAEAGQGPPLVIVPGWLCHLQEMWTHPAAESARRKLTENHRLIWYDRLGCGLSDRSGFEPSMENDIEQLEAVLSAAGVDRCSMVGYSFGGPPAAAFTAANPDRVERLVLHATYARGDALASQSRHDALKQLIAADWGLGSGAFATLFLPNGSGRDLRWFARFQRQAAGAEDAIRLLDFMRTQDVRDQLTAITRPTLVLSNRRDAVIPLDRAKEIAALVPRATLHILEGNEHDPFIRDSGNVIESILAFVMDRPLTAGHAVEGGSEPLTPREREVLRLIAEGEANKQIAAHLGIRPSTVERHVANLYSKINARGRADAVIHAIAAGIVPAPTG